MVRKKCLPLLALVVFSFGIWTTESSAAADPRIIAIKECDAAGFDPQITAPGSYQLVRNLTATGNCLLVAADNVTIELNGFVIQGNGTGAAIRRNTIAVGIGPTIRNGTISNFSTGIFFEDNNLLQVERVTFVGNTVAGISGNGRVTVRNSAFLYNGAGIVLGNGSANVLADNWVFANNGIGIGVGCPSNILGNTILLNLGGNLVLGFISSPCNIEHTLAP